MHAERGVVVVRVIGVKRTDHGEIVDAFGHVREERADLGPAIAVFFEVPLRPFEEEFFVARTVTGFRVVEGDGFPVVSDELGLGIERVDVRYAAGHEQEDDALGLGREVAGFGSERIDGAAGVFGQQFRDKRGEESTAGGRRA